MGSSGSKEPGTRSEVTPSRKPAANYSGPAQKTVSANVRPAGLLARGANAGGTAAPVAREAPPPHRTVKRNVWEWDKETPAPVRSSHYPPPNQVTALPFFNSGNQMASTSSASTSTYSNSQRNPSAGSTRRGNTRQPWSKSAKRTAPQAGQQNFWQQPRVQHNPLENATAQQMSSHVLHGERNVNLSTRNRLSSETGFRQSWQNEPLLNWQNSAVERPMEGGLVRPDGNKAMSPPQGANGASRRKLLRAAKGKPSQDAVYRQIDDLLLLLKNELCFNLNDDLTLGSKFMMALYNEKLLLKDPSVSFGNMLSVLGRDGLILPKNHPKGSPSDINFVGERVTMYMSNKDTGLSEKFTRSDSFSSRPMQLDAFEQGSCGGGPKARKIVEGQPNKNFGKGSTSAPWANLAKPEHNTVEDPMTHNIPKPKNLPPSERNATCTSCGDDYVYDEAHRQSDEHQFTILYRKLIKQGHGETPNELSGAPHSMIIQGRATKEKRSKMILNVLQSETHHNVVLEIILTYCAENVTVSNISSFILQGSHKLTLGSFGNLNFSQKKTRSTVNLHLDTSSTMCEEFIVVFKFKKVHQEANTPAVEYFLMKKMLVRVDDDSTREDGEVVESKSSVQSDDLVQEQSTSCYEVVIVKDDSLDVAKPKMMMKVVWKLEEYPLPKELSDLFNSGLRTSDKKWSKTLTMQREILDDLTSGLTPSNYSRLFSLLLFLEEHQTVADLKEYTMQNEILRRDHGLFALEVPGLAENRPSVLKYDKIFVTLPNGETHIGTVKCIQSSEIKIHMKKRFLQSYLDNMRVTVRFSFNRNCLKVMHRALELMENMENMINAVCFPKVYSKCADNLPVMSWFNRQVGFNPEQCQAVQNIVNGTSKPAPYLVFGPPGTGKTVTIVETIKQIWRLHENSHILATAPSNSAADLLAQRIIESLPVSEVLRIYSPSVDFSQVPENLHRCSNFEGSESCIPEKKTLMKYRVIVCTLICAGRLYTGGFQSGYFSHIFVDECGHAMEPTALVPFAGLLGPPHKPTQIVLSGDPKQLGPVVRSPVAKQVGLGNSMLGRLMESVDMYKHDCNGKYNPMVLTKLVNNFRSHPDILKVPNELFYDNELQPEEKVLTHSAVNWEHLPTKGFPMIFHGVSGREDQEAKSPSYFNISEVDEVAYYVERILDSKFCGQKLRPDDIGVISPYRGQISEIHRALERKRIKGISVGTVEEFQGQERRVIIISTVRSNPLQLQIDRKFRIGFVKEPKRFNVAVTRAKALLIVIGNPVLLETDHNWCYLLRYIYSNGGYTGCKYLHDVKKPLPDPEDHSKQIDAKMQSHFQLLLDLNQKVVENLQEEEDEGESVFATDTAVEELMHQIRCLKFFTDCETSAVEKYVSPPMMLFE